jgi:XTP/dITP diphosphohydrolase
LASYEVVIATKNRGKVREFVQILGEILPKDMIGISSLLDFEDVPEIVEDGVTFSENALIKARAVSSMKWAKKYVVIADDSGIEVDALNGAPGVKSARYAGPDASDEENNNKLLSDLSGVPEGERGATFTIAIAIVGRGGKEGVVTGFCKGVITTAPRGSGGFGYDPLFYYPPLKKTYSEMDDSEKNKISHRGVGIRKLAKVLPDYL